jgi:hypothetical protein
MKRITVVLSARATKEIDDAALWWAERGSPTFIDDAVAAALTLELLTREHRLCAHAEAGPR